MKPTRTTVSGFRKRLFIRIVLVVLVLTAVGALLAQHHLSQASARELKASIEERVASADRLKEARQTVLAGICSDLARQSRILAALEDNALDLLYPSAANELRQLMREQELDAGSNTNPPLHARFYRFLDRKGRLIKPGSPAQHGRLQANWDRQIELPGLPTDQEVGYLVPPGPSDTVVEFLTVPIVSLETFQAIAALVVGFPLNVRSELPSADNLSIGIWSEGRLVLPSAATDDCEKLERSLPALLKTFHPGNFAEVDLPGGPHRLLVKPLNPDSAYPTAHAVFLSSMLPLKARQVLIRNRILLASGLILLAGLAAAHYTANRMARPVEELASASDAEYRQRVDAETALDTTSRELERAARFSADASHQLKTPVAVLRAGLEELLVDSDLPASSREEVRSLITHTVRLTQVIEDLLLLSRLDAGRLDLKIKPVDLRLLIDALLDDLSVLPQERDISVEVEGARAIWVMGNPTYTSLILQNLLENAWKYNRPGGRIRVAAEKRGDRTVCGIGNTGEGIPAKGRSQVFERFHRGHSGENVPGYGLGLNLVSKLVDLHGGSIQLADTEDDWTEFVLILRSATVPEDLREGIS